MESEDNDHRDPDHRDAWELSPFYAVLVGVFAFAYLEVALASPPGSTAPPATTYNQAAAAFLYGPKDVKKPPAREISTVEKAREISSATYPPIPRPRPTATRSPS